MQKFLPMLALLLSPVMAPLTYACEENTRTTHVMVVESASHAKSSTRIIVFEPGSHAQSPTGGEPRVQAIAGTFDLSFVTHCVEDHDNLVPGVDENGEFGLLPRVTEYIRMEFSQIQLRPLEDDLRVYLDVPANVQGDTFSGTTNPCNDPFYALSGSCFYTSLSTTEGTLSESGITIHGWQSGYFDGGAASSYTVTGLFDDDRDSLPNAYENGFAFLDPQDGSDAQQDFDGDGSSNYIEYKFATDPADPKSSPRHLNALLTVLQTLLE